MMDGWLYVDRQVRGPVRGLERDRSEPGLVRLSLAADLLQDVASLRREVAVDAKALGGRRLVRVLRRRRAGRRVWLDVVDLGPPEQSREDRPGDDWLIIDGHAVGSVAPVRSDVAGRAEAQPGQALGHLTLQVPTDQWRELRCGAEAPLAGIGRTAVEAMDDRPDVAVITPPLVSMLELLDGPDHELAGEPPRVELVRLGQRVRLGLEVFASDWGARQTLVVARVVWAAGLAARPTEAAERSAVLV
jgi:hypothetical protein